MPRVQLALNVNDIEEAVSFYTRLFGTEPAKRRPGYANFAIDQPPLKLVLLENPGQGGSLNHLGVEVDSTSAVEAEQARLAEAGLAAVDERDTTCCYARQDKFWVKGPPAASGGRSTPSWPTARLSTAPTTAKPAAAAAPPQTPPEPPRARLAASCDRVRRRLPGDVALRKHARHPPGGTGSGGYEPPRHGGRVTMVDEIMAAAEPGVYGRDHKPAPRRRGGLPPRRPVTRTTPTRRPDLFYSSISIP